ncbi:hypothetical protein P7K49_027075 [Saguinus oedipus]|uniref:Uncharacterized protein n=1 Tax=Saguinus oedipus TaxID=9490 RepID=A0ABQ9UEY9_SAGOE|nr:hypothetical protein P7K49_027075 [Saguinus oedipus]
MLVTHAAPPNFGQKENQSHLLCTKSCHAEVPAKLLRQPQESRWQPMQLLYWESSAPQGCILQGIRKIKLPPSITSLLAQYGVLQLQAKPWPQTGGKFNAQRQEQVSANQKPGLSRSPILAM